MSADGTKGISKVYRSIFALGVPAQPVDAEAARTLSW
jgi:hypothetical protein